MNVTLMTDASWCPHTKVVGYGWWVASDRARQPGQGVVQKPLYGSTEAEMAAVLCSMRDCVQRLLIQPKDVVLVQLDCTGAIERLDGTQPAKGSYESILNSFRHLVYKHDLAVTFRHVKAHTKLMTGRNGANNMCDIRAKEEMRRARDRILLDRKKVQIGLP